MTNNYTFRGALMNLKGQAATFFFPLMRCLLFLVLTVGTYLVVQFLPQILASLHEVMAVVGWELSVGSFLVNMVLRPTMVFLGASLAWYGDVYLKAWQSASETVNEGTLDLLPFRVGVGNGVDTQQVLYNTRDLFINNCLQRYKTFMHFPYSTTQQQHHFTGKSVYTTALLFAGQPLGSQRYVPTLLSRSVGDNLSGVLFNRVPEAGCYVPQSMMNHFSAGLGKGGFSRPAIAVGTTQQGGLSSKQIMWPLVSSVCPGDLGKVTGRQKSFALLREKATPSVASHSLVTSGRFGLAKGSFAPRVYEKKTFFPIDLPFDDGLPIDPSMSQVLSLIHI